jgi:hypothetical protein
MFNIFSKQFSMTAIFVFNLASEYPEIISLDALIDPVGPTVVFIPKALTLGVDVVP